MWHGRDQHTYRDQLLEKSPFRIWWSVSRKPSYALVTTTRVVTFMVATIKKMFSACVTRFLQPMESIKNVRVGFPKGVGLPGKLHVPCLPSLSRGEFLSVALSGVRDYLGGSANNNASWAGKGMGNSIFSSSHSFSPRKQVICWDCFALTPRAKHCSPYLWRSCLHLFVVLYGCLHQPST